jgi:homoserine O-succinyltransferase
MILAESDEAGAYIVTDRDCRNIFISGHAEYSRDTLANEYNRDVLKGINPDVPVNYFKNDNPENKPDFQWKSHASMLYANWLNHIVYLHTPYDLNEL